MKEKVIRVRVLSSVELSINEFNEELVKAEVSMNTVGMLRFHLIEEVDLNEKINTASEIKKMEKICLESLSPCLYEDWSRIKTRLKNIREVKESFPKCTGDVINVGKYKLQEMENGNIFISEEDSEEGEFRIKDFENCIKDFFDEKF